MRQPVRRGLIAALALALGGLDGALGAGRLRAALAPGEPALMVAAGAGAGLGLALLALGLASGVARLLRWRGRSSPRALEPALLLLALGLMLAPLRLGAGQAPPPRVEGARGPDLVLITLDTLRADHVGAIGGARRAVQTPNLDALAASGALFTRGVSPVPLTLPAHAAMLTGQHPLALGLLRNGEVLGEAAPRVAERLRAEGWRTAAFVAAAVLRGKTGLQRGFDRYDDRFSLGDRLAELGLLGPLLRAGGLPRERAGEQTVARALAWMAEPSDAPRFLWVHLYDCHAPYRPPAPWDTRYPWSSPDAQGNPTEMRAARERIRAEHQFFLPFVPPDLRAAAARYAGEVSHVDALVGRLLGALPAEARVLAAADHGESLTEHGELLGHGAQVYDTTTRVPIWVRAPEVSPGARVEGPVPLEAVGPTLLALAGLPAEGPTLLDAIAAPWPTLPLLSFAGTQQSQDAVPLQKGWELGLRGGEDKWIIRRSNSLERYLLLDDPGELEDRAPEAPDAARQQARQALESARSRLESAASEAGELDPETADELRALGYTE